MRDTDNLNQRLDDIEETLFAEFGHLRKTIRKELQPLRISKESPKSAVPAYQFRAPKEPPQVTIESEVPRKWLLTGLAILGLSITTNLGLIYMVKDQIHERIPTREHIELMKRGKECLHERH